MAYKKAPQITRRIPLVFKYWDGEKNAVIEPLIVLMEMQKKLGAEFIDETINLKSENLKPEDYEKIIKALDIFREIFKIKPISVDEAGDVTGLGTTELFELVAEFIEWTSEIKKKQEPKQTLLKSTVHPS